jgi:hypothetical protein
MDFGGVTWMEHSKIIFRKSQFISDNIIYTVGNGLTVNFLWEEIYLSREEGGPLLSA